MAAKFLWSVRRKRQRSFASRCPTEFSHYRAAPPSPVLKCIHLCRFNVARLSRVCYRIRVLRHDPCVPCRLRMVEDGVKCQRMSTFRGAVLSALAIVFLHGYLTSQSASMGAGAAAGDDQ